MPAKKKQHYVPRFYLRNFSWGEEKSICLLNKKTEKIIKNSNLYNQCYEPYFYGEDSIIEDAFSKIEGRASHIINNIIKLAIFPARKSADHNALLIHIILQHARTKYSSIEQKEMAENLIHNMMEKDTRFSSIDKSSIKVGFNNPVGLNLQAAAKSIPLVMDLEFKILKNETQLAFITSDNPVVLYNSCYEAGRTGSYTGLATKGLQIFLPLSPSYMIIFYDSTAYKIGERRKQFANITSVSDVRQLNDLQMLNSLENVYFHKKSNLTEIKNSLTRMAVYEKNQKSLLHEYPTEDLENGLNTSLIHFHRQDLKINLRLQFVKQLWAPIELDVLKKPKRDPNLCKIHSNFMSLVDENIYTASEFSRYIHNQSKIEEANALLRRRC